MFLPGLGFESGVEEIRRGSTDGVEIPAIKLNASGQPRSLTFDDF